MTFIYIFSLILFMILCTVLCLAILMQESKSSGLGASFGGDTSDSLFGASTADVLKRFTGWLSVIFLASCVVLSMWTAAKARTQVQEVERTSIEETV